MTLAPGTRLGAYHILSAVGAGGMGEVYKARDTKLDRDIAIKVLPPAFAADPERIARLEREAKTLASLNHPNIAHIYGLEDSTSTPALVMEFVEGPTLADRIARGPIPLDEALPIARQIADALEAAHEHGIIHRDLKPANIKVRDDGTVKVLDFGLAKAMEPVASGASSAVLANSPTITSPALMTGVGVLLGTAAYMSPEQAKGRPADKRSDIWAFGCVLYETLTGRRAFEGDDVSDTLAAVLRGQPDWDALPAGLPEHIGLMLRRCLEKDRLRRIADISTARFLISEPLASSAPASGSRALPSRRSGWRRTGWSLASAITGGALVGAIVWSLRPSVPPQPVTRFTYTLDEGEAFTNLIRSLIALSQDGTQIAYVANRRVYLKSTKDLHAAPIPGTESPQGVTNPVFSPDGHWIAFWSSADNTLKKIATSGGAPQTLCKAINPYGMSWDGTSIFFGQGAVGILRVAENGGNPETVVKANDNEIPYGPQLLPDQRSLLFTLVTGTAPDRWDTAQIVVQQLGSTQRKPIFKGGADARFVPTGHLLYALGGVLFALPFDVRHLEVTGGPVAVVEGVARAGAASSLGAAQFALSRTGTLAYLPGPGSAGSSQLDLALLDRAGTVNRLKLPPRPYQAPRFSPDGRQLAVGVDDGREAHVWVYELSGANSIHQLTLGGKNRFPVWSRDNTHVAFQSDREGDPAIWWQRADGTDTAVRLTTPERGHTHIPDAWSPKDDALLFEDAGGSTLALSMLSPSDKKASLFDAARSSYPSNFLLSAVFSPDGKWIAYASHETENQRPQVYVRPFPATDGSISTMGDGATPFWPNPNELYFSPGDPGQPLLVARVTTQPAFRFGTPAPVPRPGAIIVPGAPRNYDGAPGSEQIVIVVDASGLTTALGPGGVFANGNLAQIHVVTNWFEELKQRVPRK
jgi:serine/threonine-protein kinase